MNRDGCRNCKHMVHEGAVQIMKCGLDKEWVKPLDSCGNYKIKDAEDMEDVQ